MHTHVHTHTLTFFDFLFKSDLPSLTILAAFNWSVSGPIRFHLRSRDWQKNNNKENMFQNDFVLIFSFFFSLRVFVCLDGRGFLFLQGLGCVSIYICAVTFAMNDRDSTTWICASSVMTYTTMVSVKM